MSFPFQHTLTDPALWVLMTATPTPSVRTTMKTTISVLADLITMAKEHVVIVKVCNFVQYVNLIWFV